MQSRRTMPRPLPPAKALTVGDLFCGAGGFSEGFAQAGFRLKWAIDNWGPAAETYRKNHPGVEVSESDVLKIDPRTLPRVDVLIGSPPCVHFSLANRGGNGDREKGLVLVNRFLTFVEVIRPKYWVMENVPNLALLLQRDTENPSERTTAERMAGVQTVILDAASYGAPQHRKRMFSGRFPVPSPVFDGKHAQFIPLKSILTALPDPTDGNARRNAEVTDPVYPGLSIRREQLRDHFEDLRWRLTRYERQRAKQQKVGNFVYGKMAYPDEVSKPSRTITATRTGGSRSTIVVPMGERNVRTLTMREAACIQGFPISYQFWASSMSDKDALVGNAVSPVIARAIADSILKDTGRPLPDAPLLESHPMLPDPLIVRVKRTHHFSINRRFRGAMQVDMRPNHRVELDNRYALGLPADDKEGFEVPLRWTTRLYLGYATKYKSYELNRVAAISLAIAALQSESLESVREPMTSYFRDLSKLCNSNLPDADTLQQKWSGRRTTGRTPDYYCRRVATFIDSVFPQSEWGKSLVPSTVTQPIIDPFLFAKGTKAEEGQPLEMSVRLLASAIGMALLCSSINDKARFPQEVLDAPLRSNSPTEGSFRRESPTLDDSHWMRSSTPDWVARRGQEKPLLSVGESGGKRRSRLTSSQYGAS